MIGDKVWGYDAAFTIEDSDGTIKVGYKTVFTGKIEVACTEGAVIFGDSVIGAGAVVTRKYTNPNMAIGGNPAKIIKEHIRWEHERL